MAEDRMAVLEMLRKLGADGDVDFLREGVRVLAAALMEAEVTELTGVPTCGSCTAERDVHRPNPRQKSVLAQWLQDRRVIPAPQQRSGGFASQPMKETVARNGGVDEVDRHLPASGLRATIACIWG